MALQFQWEFLYRHICEFSEAETERRLQELVEVDCDIWGNPLLGERAIDLNSGEEIYVDLAGRRIIVNPMLPVLVNLHWGWDDDLLADEDEWNEVFLNRPRSVHESDYTNVSIHSRLSYQLYKGFPLEELMEDNEEDEEDIPKKKIKKY